jgi:hypothetical protein
MLLTKERIVSHIPKFGDAASTARDAGFSTGEVSSTLDMHISRTHISHSRYSFSRGTS